MALLSTDPIDLLLDSSGDLVIQDGDLMFSSGAAGVAQAIRQVVLLVRGEWFLDLDAGLPYFERDGVPASDAIMGQQFNQVHTESVFREAIETAPGVGEIVSVSASYDNSTRQLTVAWVVVATFGDTISDSLSRGI